MSLKQLAKRRLLPLFCRLQYIYFTVIKKERLMIVDLLHQLEGLDYVILKADVPYMPTDFPLHYPIGKDLDILVSKKDFSAAISAIKLFKESCGWKYGVKIKHDANRVQYRFVFFGEVLHYLIDCTVCLDLCGIESELLANKERRGLYFVPSLRSEQIYRYLEYLRSPHKTYHLEYVKKHIDEWDVALAGKYGIELPEYDGENL